MREFTGKRELFRPAVTRFTTAFITLQSIHKQKTNLRMFISEQGHKANGLRKRLQRNQLLLLCQQLFGVVF